MVVFLHSVSSLQFRTHFTLRHVEDIGVGNRRWGQIVAQPRFKLQYYI